MKTYNITAQIYLKKDKYKQTILMNELVESTNKTSAEDIFKLNLIINDAVLVKILSTEYISQVAS